jgi:hypothetical protein
VITVEALFHFIVVVTFLTYLVTLHPTFFSNKFTIIIIWLTPGIEPATFAEQIIKLQTYKIPTEPRVLS